MSCLVASAARTRRRVTAASRQLSALDLAERRKRELGGRLVYDLLRKTTEPPPAPAAAPAAVGDSAGDDEDFVSDEWNPAPDEEWREVRCRPAPRLPFLFVCRGASVCGTVVPVYM
jgi:hypothetical protein